jgi:RNA polymerase sigma-70 factor (ECF subfamily)
LSEETFIALLTPNLKALRIFLQRRLRASSPVDDIVQETLLRALTRRDQLRAPSKFKAWLWSIAMNELRMFLRRGHNDVSLADLPRFEPSDKAPSPLAVCEGTERKEWLRAGMAKLVERECIAIQLIDFSGKSMAEAAKALGISVSATKSVHFRARRHLARVLRDTKALSVIPKSRASQMLEKRTARHTNRGPYSTRAGSPIHAREPKQLGANQFDLAGDCRNTLESVLHPETPQSVTATADTDRLRAA